MNYKYRKGQIFGKRLKVPKGILDNIYNCNLRLSDYIKYDLDDKIPLSCINEFDRKIIEKFGMEKCKKLDWELINKPIFYSGVSIVGSLMTINPENEDINGTLYELIKDKLRPEDFSPKMIELYKDKVFIIPKDIDNDTKCLMILYNSGSADLRVIVSNWNLFKDKDLSYCLSHDTKNENGITNDSLKQFMSQHGNLISLLIKYEDLYKFIGNYSKLSSEEEKYEHIKVFTDKVLNNSYQKRGEDKKIIPPTNDEFRELFKYTKIEDFFKTLYKPEPSVLINELKTLDEDYIFNMPIPLSTLFEYDVIGFINTFGLKNIVDFDNECGHFFTNNNCEMLKLMFEMYLHYASNISDSEKNIYTKKKDELTGLIENRPYTKDEFYEAMKRMIVYGPTNLYYNDKAPDYRTMTGEFKKRYFDLFISKQAPEELQKLFYTKSITPQIIIDHPEYIEYLKGKDLKSCFEKLEIIVNGSSSFNGYQNIYKFLSKKLNDDEIFNFIIEYSDTFKLLFADSNDKYQFNPNINETDDIDTIQNKMIKSLRHLLTVKHIPYPDIIPKRLFEQYPDMFLSKDAPKELQEAFYNRTITTDFILSNPEYKKYLKGKDIEIIFNMSNRFNFPNKGFRHHRRDINSPISVIKEVFKDDALDIMLVYGNYLQQIYNIDGFQGYYYNEGCSQNELLDLLDKIIYDNIVKGNVIYDENISSHLKKSYPTLFLDYNVSKEIKEKFYNKKLTLEDFNNNPQLIDIFENTNIACGFPQNASWIIPLFDDKENVKTANYNRLKVIAEFYKIQDFELQNAFKEFFEDNSHDFDFNKMEVVADILSKLSLSNSSEIYTFRKELAKQILKADNPLDCFDKIEELFIKNNIPTVGKIYSCFEILHPHFQGFVFDSTIISPTLSKASLTTKKAIVFSDLLKAAFGSNNRSINTYLKNIDIGSKLYARINSGEIQYESLSEDDKAELLLFSKHLITLFNNTMQNKNDNYIFHSSGDVIKDIDELVVKISPDGNLDYNLADRVIKMFCIFAGISTLEEAKEYINRKIQNASERNTNAATTGLVLEKGDFVKGIGSLSYLRNILQNGSVSKEFLGSSANSDATPLDTDLSMILDDEGTTREKVEKTAAKAYGPIWIVLKNDDRFTITRTNEGPTEVKRDLNKLETFYTGVVGKDHYGIRTGFASSEINYILTDRYNDRIGLEIAINGFYIPVFNLDGKLLFSPQDFEKLRKKMNGLSYYEETSYTFSNNLVNDEVIQIESQIDQSDAEVQLKRKKINKAIKEALDELGLELKINIDGDLTENYVELIDTGSTGRGTNKPGDGDFDFMMRLDKAILSDPSKLQNVKETLLKHFGKNRSEGVIGSGDFRLKNVVLDDIVVDIDITFIEKTEKIQYSTDMALKDRLDTIKKIDPQKYKYVIANILLAKKVLKEAKAYKPNRGDDPQGGLGGVGIENWILQHGGSFIDAAKDFIAEAEGKDFETFINTNQIWDFGDNHLAEKRGHYPHDNFVNNMSKDGYNKMVTALKEYLKSIEITNEENIKR